MTKLRTCRNSALIRKDELAKDILTKGNKTFPLFPAISQAQIPIFAQASTFAKVFAPIPSPPNIYTNVDLQRTTKLALKFFIKGQKYGKVNFAPWDKALKAQNLDLYYGSSYIECYYFYEQYKDYFDMANAINLQSISFATPFLQNRINFRWQQLKTQVESNNTAFFYQRQIPGLFLAESRRIYLIYNQHLD